MKNNIYKLNLRAKYFCFLGLVLFATLGYSQTKTIQGTITSSLTDEGLAGASVRVVGSTIGVITDVNGYYVLDSVPNNATLRISYIGFMPREVKMSETTTYNFTLISDDNTMDDVVVVGYGTQTKATVTGSIATVDAEELTTVPASNMTALLAGRLPGLIVNQGNGRPGDDTAGISIRGFGANNGVGGTAQNESPLVIVDGIERSFTQLDPNEIESISILKDASAAVYGVRAAAGVILVTTKRGVEGKPIISYNGTYSLQENTNFPELASYSEYKRVAANHRVGSLAPFFLEDDSFEGFITPERRAGLNEGSIPGTNWLDVITRGSAPQSQHNLNVRGGSDAAKYFVSLGYLNQGTLFETEDFNYERFNITANLDAKITKRLSATVDLGMRRQNESDSNSGGNGDFLDAYISHPAFPSSLPDGRLPGAYIANPFSPLASTSRDIGGYSDVLGDVINANFGLKYQIPGVEGLSLSTRGSILQTHQNAKQLRKKYTMFYFNGSEYLSQRSQHSTSSLAEQNNIFERITTQTSLNYQNRFNDHNIGGLLLFETQTTESEVIRATNGALLSPAVPYLFSGNPDLIGATGNASEQGRSGLVGRVNYDYQSKYLVELSFRRDQSAYFPKNSRVGFFPGASLGWVASNEKFMENSKVFSHLKLRLSASQLGNDGANSYDYIEGFGISGIGGGYVFDNNFQTGIQTLGFPNPNITWQESNIYNAGLEFGFLENKLNVEFDAFYRKRYNLLARDDDNQNLPQTVGVSPPLQNIESRDNRGLEAVVSYRNNFDKVRFNASGNFSWAREKWINRFVLQEFDDPDRQRLNSFDGEWVNRTFGYVFDGFFNSQEEIDNATIDYDGGSAGNTNMIPGDIRVKDINGDGIISDLDRVLIGRSGTPEIIFGLNTQAEYKGFDITMFWQGAANFEKAFNDARERGIDLGTGGSYTPFKYVTDYAWSPENPENARFPVDTRGVSNYGGLDEYRLDSKYVRLKNLALGYTLPASALNAIGASTLRLYLTGTNLFTIDGLGIYPFDPESGDSRQYPSQRVFTLGANVSF